MKSGARLNRYSQAWPLDLKDEPLPAAEAKRTRIYEVCKRIFDFAFGTLLFIVSMPVILFVALAIRLETAGSPFFFQTRLGRHGKPFRIFKLRGMFEDAKVRYPELYDYSKNKDLGFHFHHQDDPRVTRVGRFIRRTSIDELPNFWNVMMGDMSLVGPRPEIPDVLALYGSHRDEYLSVKPGVTCTSKCTGRDALTKQETIDLDLEYVRTRTLKKDLAIVWRTFQGVVLRHNVY